MDGPGAEGDIVVGEDFLMNIASPIEDGVELIYNVSKKYHVY